jgi:hypothetical protein
MKKQSVWLGYDIHLDTRLTLKPTKLVSWTPDKYKRNKPDSPFHYKSDALTGLSLLHLSPAMRQNSLSDANNWHFCQQSWLALEPHHEMYFRSHSRVESLRQALKAQPNEISNYFERQLSEILESSSHPWGIDLKHLSSLIDSIEYLELKSNTPLLFNFKLKLSAETVTKLHYLYSMLVNLRTIIALDFNSRILDPTFEAVKIDSITDYLSKAEYLANDALLYLHFKKSKAQLPDSFTHDMEKAFKAYNHNGFCLIESLPKSFLNELRKEELEETLYLVQMDWLLGSESGLLYRIREELYGLREGYENIFWTDLELKENHFDPKLEVNCLLSQEDLSPKQVAA